MTATATRFSQRLRQATAPAHAAVESSGFVVRLLDGSLTPQAVADLLAQQWVIYEALEQALDACDHPALTPFVDPDLARRPALESDMRYHFGPAWRDGLGGEVPVTAAAWAYAEHLRGVGSHDGACLLGHHYVRYLGDLSGGQVVARLVARHYGVAEAGLSFYRFSNVGPTKPYKDTYRSRLDHVDLSVQDQQTVIDHAAKAFELSRRVFDDLGSRYAALRG